MNGTGDRRRFSPDGMTEQVIDALVRQVGEALSSVYVSVHCDQCGEGPAGPGVEAYWSTETAALDAAAAEGWRVGPGGRLLCSACGPVLTCEAEGHEFSEWRHPVTTAGHPTGSEYRHCRRCCLHDSRPVRRLVGARSGSGKTSVAALLLAGADVTGEVA